MPERKRPRTAPTRKAPVVILPEERAEILRLAGEGVPYREIAERFGRPQGTINRAISDGILDGTVERRNQRQDNRKT